MVTLYSKPQCVQCTMTARVLDSKGVDYKTIDMTKDPEALEYVKSLGYLQAPVVVTDSTHWSGFDPVALATHIG